MIGLGKVGSSTATKDQITLMIVLLVIFASKLSLMVKMYLNKKGVLLSDVMNPSFTNRWNNLENDSSSSNRFLFEKNSESKAVSMNLKNTCKSFFLL